jgi:hypothetical protein
VIINYTVTGKQSHIYIEIYIPDIPENKEYINMFSSKILFTHIDANMIINNSELSDIKDIFTYFNINQFGNEMHLTINVDIEKIILHNETLYDMLMYKISKYKTPDAFWDNVGKVLAFSLRNVIESRIGKFLDIMVQSNIENNIKEFSNDFIERYGERLAIYKLFHKPQKRL